MKKVIIHIGAGKCGSSALQEYLSKDLYLRSKDDKAVSYIVIRADGSIIMGQNVAESAHSSIYQYAASANLPVLDTESVRDNCLNFLSQTEADTIILSCEGWINDPDLAEEKLSWLAGHDVEVDVYVRPPVEWLNSAWWQWGAWSNCSFEHWINRTMASTHWVKNIKKWSELSFVKKINVRLLPKDIVYDFLTIHEISSKKNEDNSEDSSVSNVSLPGSILRFYQKRRELRPSPHESKIDFSLSRQLGKIRSRPDWVIPLDLAKLILENTKPYNNELKDFLESDQHEKIINDARWWDHSVYSSDVKNASGRDISIEETDQLIYQSLMSLHESELKIIRLKNRLRHLENKNMK